MKGSPMKRNFGIGASPMKDDKTKKVKLDEVTVSGGKKTERGADKFARVKKETKGAKNKTANLTKEYGGNWKKGKDKSGNTLYLNEKGQNVKEAAISQSKAKQAKIAEYKKKNTTR